MNESSRKARPGLARLNQARTSLIFAGLALLLLLLFVGGAAGQSQAVPAEPPIAAAGLNVHAERCANCHGPTGQGDGELAANLPNPPVAHGSLEYLRTAVPADMFDTITNGRIPQGMPPFGPESSEPLSDDERWDVIAAIYTFGTPIESVGAGRDVYLEHCLACHGEEGQGDGPEAGDLAVHPGDLGSAAYWFAISNQAVFDSLEAGGIAAHEELAELGEDDLWSVVDYMRTFSYEYTDSLAPFRPVKEATIRGAVVNGTTGEPLVEGSSALLRAFTQDLNITLTMTSTLDADGQYTFDLTDVPQEWFFRVGVTHDDVEFGSDFGQVSFDVAELDMPITVYEAASDPSALNIQQLHLILAFGPDTVQVNELYQVTNDDATVFVGERGAPELGTFEIGVPAGAEQLSFQRGFGSIDSFIPAQEIIQTESGYADTLPLRPGPSGLTLLVSYELPYDDQATLSHPLNYPTSRVNLVLPEVGVELADTTGWVAGGQTDMGGGAMNTYGQSNLPAGAELTLALEGKARETGSATAGLVGDNTTELLIGAAAALLVVALTAVVIRRWSLETGEEWDQDDLVQALADLDDEYEAGEIDERTYQRERAELKAELAAIWHADEEE
ncbi:MAG: c-type cytochrome [Chloroflexota bacterium]|nr:MAG: c-type cytochrome [Chloroflexota bacterium]